MSPRVWGVRTMSKQGEVATNGWEGQRGIGAWFAGRAARKEYWLWVAPSVVAGFLTGFLELPEPLARVLEFLFGLPIFFIWIRRLHDLGLSGWLAPVINFGLRAVDLATASTGALGQVALGFLGLGTIVLLGVLPGKAETNRYGPPPRRPKETDLQQTFS